MVYDLGEAFIHSELKKERMEWNTRAYCNKVTCLRLLKQTKACVVKIKSQCFTPENVQHWMKIASTKQQSTDLNYLKQICLEEHAEKWLPISSVQSCSEFTTKRLEAITAAKRCFHQSLAWRGWILSIFLKDLLTNNEWWLWKCTFRAYW